MRHPFAIYIEHGDVTECIGGQVRSLAGEADPMVESGTGFVAETAHVPLAHQRGPVTGGLQEFREGSGTGPKRRIVVDDAVVVHVLPGQNGGPARRTQRCRDHRVLEENAAFRQRIQVGRIEHGVEETQFVVTLIVHQDEDDVGRIGGVSRKGNQRQDGRAGEKAGSDGPDHADAERGGAQESRSMISYARIVATESILMALSARMASISNCAAFAPIN